MDFINNTIVEAFSKGMNLEDVQKKLLEKNIHIDINSLVKRSREIPKKHFK